MMDHFGINSADLDAAKRFYDSVLEPLETLHAPRLWPEYHDRYYAAFVRDPDGNNVEAFCHTANA